MLVSISLEVSGTVHSTSDALFVLVGVLQLWTLTFWEEALSTVCASALPSLSAVPTVGIGDAGGAGDAALLSSGGNLGLVSTVQSRGGRLG